MVSNDHLFLIVIWIEGNLVWGCFLQPCCFCDFLCAFSFWEVSIYPIIAIVEFMFRKIGLLCNLRVLYFFTSSMVVQSNDENKFNIKLIKHDALLSSYILSLFLTKSVLDTRKLIQSFRKNSLIFRVKFYKYVVEEGIYQHYVSCIVLEQCNGLM